MIPPTLRHSGPRPSASLISLPPATPRRPLPPPWRDTRVLATTAVLFTFMIAHTVLETARDALFLAKLGPQRLAWAYLAIAIGAMLAVTAMRQWGRMRDPRRLLIGFLAFAVAGTTVIAMTIASAPYVVFVLYVWTGLVATLVVPSFWTLTDRSLRIYEAKRVFAVIGAGGTLGAMIGSATAAMLGRVVPARQLVTVGAIAFGVAMVVAILLAPKPREAVAVRPERADPDARQRSRRYVHLLVGFGIVSTIALTLGDLTFKRVLAERLAPGDLATVFGTIYTGLNVLGLVIQLAVTPRLLGRLGVGGALLVLPIVIVTTALGFALTGTLIAILALKFGDGGLRHSLHRVTNEILFVPIPSAVRDGAKPIADAVSQRGGQAIAALLVFATASFDGSRGLALITALVACIWLATLVVTRKSYVGQFRDTLRAGEAHRDAVVPGLDADSVELLIEALSSPDEVEALASLELLAQRGARLPALVLYHPRQRVVRRALELLHGEVRPDIVRVLAHLIEHSDPEIRAAALVASSRTKCHHEQLVAALDDPDPDVKAAALIGLVDDPGHASDIELGIDKLLRGTQAERLALARAIGYSPDERFILVLRDLLAYREPPVMRHVLAILARAPELADLEQLLGVLEDPHVRGDARRVFLAVGTPGLRRLISALDDPRTPLVVRRHIPRTISRFGTQQAASALVARLGREPDGTTEFKILRALGRMRSNDPRLTVDVSTLREYARRAVADAARYATLADRLAAEPPDRSSPAADLLRELLAEKRRYAIEHVFRTLGIVHPRAGLRSVHDAITGSDDERRAAAREVLEGLVTSDLRVPLLTVLDDELTPDERRERLGTLAVGPFGSYEAFAAELLADPSESVRCVIAHHVAERRLVDLKPDLARLRSLAGPPMVQHAYEQALARLDA
ncbi:MAG TPA: hypothetical protein VFQ53_28145 [Kofleriaceae bacterium]|nr:hypothetical protein [Kofleriaceae bacterium]